MPISRRAWATFTVVAAATTVLGYVPFLRYGVGDVWRGLVEIPWQSMPGRRLAFPGAADAFVSMYWQHVVVIGLAGVFIAGRACRARSLSSAAAAATSAGLTGMFFWGYALGRGDELHQIPSLVYAALLAPWLAAECLRLRPRLLGAGAAALLTAYVLACQQPAQKLASLARGSLNWRTARPIGLPAAGWGQFAPNSPMIAAVRYVGEHYGDDEYLFVGLQRHDRVWVNDLMFYFLAGKLPAVRDHHFDPLVTNTEPVQRRMIADLERTRPRAAVLWADGSYSNEENASAISTGVTLLDEYLSRAYRPVACFGPYLVLERRPRNAAKGGKSADSQPFHPGPV